jgi:hypothetical protein
MTPSAPLPPPGVPTLRIREAQHALLTVVLVAERERGLSPDNQAFLDACIATVRDFYMGPVHD